MYVYLYVSNDELELPLAVADTGRELARMIGKDEHIVYDAVSKKLKRFKKVWIEDEDADC